MCIICQKPGEKLNEVQYKATEKTMLSVATKHYNDRVLRRLNSIAASDDCVATDAKYHFKCWVLMKRYVQQKDNSIETQEIENMLCCCRYKNNQYSQTKNQTILLIRV